MGAPIGVVDVVVAGVAVVVAGHPAMMDAPVGIVEAAPAPPVPVVEGAVPVVVAVVSYPVAGVAVRPVVGRRPPVDMWPIQDTPVTRHVVDRVGVEIPMGVLTVTVERGVADEVVHPVLLIDGLL